MLRACKRAAACRSTRRIHATPAAASGTSSLSTFPHKLSTERAAAEQEDWREVGVFWDMENCSIPSGLDPFVVRPNIERALRTSGFLGPIYLAGYVNINTLSRGHTLESLTESGIAVHHVPSGGSRDASDRALLIDVMLWTMKHLPPAHVLLITGDSDFSVLMHKLRLLGYNILLIAPSRNGLPCSLLHAASKIWIWPDVVVGEPEGLVAEIHIPGTPLPESLVSRKKDFGISKPSMSSREDECVKDSEGIAKVKLPDGGWLPPYVVDRIVSIVKDRPGIILGDLIKELKAININPKLYGYHDYYQCLSRMDELETRYINGVGMRDGVVFNVSSHVADRKSAVIVSTKNRHVSSRLADHTEASDGMVHNDKREVKTSAGQVLVSADGEKLRKKSVGQEKSVTSGTLQSWSSRLLRFFKGS